MRIRILVLLLAVCAAAPMGARGQFARRIKAQAPATATAGGLRGPEDVGTSPAPAPSEAFSPLPAGLTGAGSAPLASPPLMVAASGLTPPAKPPASASAAAIPPPPAECRLSCAQTYYFCLAGQDAPRCPGAWSQCVSGCADTVRPAQAPP